MNDEQRRLVTVEVELASDDEVFLTEWGRELFKSSLTLANDVLKQVITITSLLLTAAVGFLDKIAVSKSWQATIFALLLAPLIVSFLALTPTVAEIDLHDPERLRAFRHKILRKKRNAILCVTCLLVAAFICTMLSLLLR